MYANNERLRIEHLTKILDCIDLAKRKIRIQKDNIHNWSSFDKLKLDSNNRIDILKMAIYRLTNRYFRVLNK